MFAFTGWSVGYEAPLSFEQLKQDALLCWQDPATPMSIWQLGAPSSSSYSLRLPGELTVDVLPEQRIVVRPREGLPQITIEHFLADQVFPRLLAHAGSPVVHAGAVRVDGSALLLVGQSGRGKSTLTASFDQSGIPLLGDDAMVISTEGGIPQVRPVYKSLRLMPDSIDALMPGAMTAGPVAHYSSKERIEVAGNRAASEVALPVRAIFAITESSGAIAIRRLPVAQACMTLVENSFALDPSCVEQARGRLAEASALARRVPMFEISYPRDYARLPEVRAAILAQVAALETA